MTTFFTSDTHFNHANIISLCNRPYSNVDEMNKAIISTWNKTVAPDDIVYHLGDVALGNKDEWGALKALNGYKILVTGNHDPNFADNKPGYIERHGHKLTDLFDEVYTNINGAFLSEEMIVNISHFPYEGDHTDEDRYSEHRIHDNGWTLIHGHTHSSGVITHSAKGSLMIHVGWDAWFRPVAVEEVLELMDSHA